MANLSETEREIIALTLVGEIDGKNYNPIGTNAARTEMANILSSIENRYARNKPAQYGGTAVSSYADREDVVRQRAPGVKYGQYSPFNLDGPSESSLKSKYEKNKKEIDSVIDAYYSGVLIPDKPSTSHYLNPDRVKNYDKGDHWSTRTDKLGRVGGHVFLNDYNTPTSIPSLNPITDFSGLANNLPQFNYQAPDYDFQLARPQAKPTSLPGLPAGVEIPSRKTFAEPVPAAPLTPVTQNALPDLPSVIRAAATGQGSINPAQSANVRVDLSKYGEPVAPRGPNLVADGDVPLGSYSGPSRRNGPRTGPVGLPSGPTQRNGPRGLPSVPSIRGAGQPSNVGASTLREGTPPSTIAQMRDMLGQPALPSIDYGRTAPATPSLSSGPSQRLGPRASAAPAPAPQARPAVSNALPSVPNVGRAFVGSPELPSQRASINQQITRTAVPVPGSKPSVPTPAAAPAVAQPAYGAPAAPKQSELPAIDSPTIKGVGVPRSKPAAPVKQNKVGKNIGRVLGGVAGTALLGPIGGLAGGYIGGKLGQKGLPSLRVNANLGPFISQEGFNATPVGKATIAGRANGGFDSGGYWSGYSNAGGGSGSGDMARAMANEQRERARAGQATFADAISRAFGGGAGVSGSRDASGARY